MAWNDIPLEDRVNKSWEEVRKAYNNRDYIKLQKYTWILADCLKGMKEEGQEQIDEV